MIFLGHFEVKAHIQRYQNMFDMGKEEVKRHD